MRRILFACAAVVPALVAGCTPAAQPTPSATPVPTAAAPTLQLMCTPEEGGTASPCTQAEYDAMVARDKLYDEAKTVLANYRQEFERLARSGAPASDTLLSSTAGEFTEAVKREMDEGFRYEGGTFDVVWVKRLAGEAKANSTVALQSCVDRSSISIFKGAQEIGLGKPTEQRHFFAPVEGRLKIVAAQNRAVESC